MSLAAAKPAAIADSSVSASRSGITSGGDRIHCHINDPEFATKTLAIFDAWRADGTIPV